MRYLSFVFWAAAWFLFASLVFGFNRVSNKYDEESKINAEFSNLYYEAQPRQWALVSSTPPLGSLQDGECVLFSSGAVQIMCRQNQDLFAVNLSCITVFR